MAQENPCRGDNAAFDIILPYWSTIKFAATRTGVAPGPYTWTVPQGTKVQAFNYGRGQSKTTAGFSAADGVALDSDTNIPKPGETINGEAVKIYGISVMPKPVCIDGGDTGVLPAAVAGLRKQDDAFLAALMGYMSPRIKLNTRGELALGIPLFLPGSGGLSGMSPNASSYRALAGDPVSQGYSNNGLATRGNTYGLAVPIWWNDEGSDSIITIDFIVDKTIVLVSGDVDNPLADVVASNLPAVVATGTRGYVFPTRLCSEWVVQLHGEVIGERSRTI